ncbi:MAG: hypothetical protein LBI99_08660 [Propionibacteriaceae bacterium]|jgi:hypothetical protein|nr:hypothetical protein [Propionibacteriaceae bacterium]
MSSPDLTPILEDLSAGRIDAAEAAKRIEALKVASGDPDATPEPSNEELGPDAPFGQEYSPYAREVFNQPPPKQAPRQRQGNGSGVDRVSVRAVGRKVRIIGDPSVATATAEGPHVLRRNASVLEVSSDGEPGPSFDGFSIFRPPLNLDEWRSLGLGKELFLRVNPRLLVDIEVTGGVLSCTDVRYLGKVRLTAGSAEITGFKEADDVLIQAGAATLKGRVTSGRSRVRCESGQVTVELEDDSNVAIRAESQLGKVTWSPSQGQIDEVVLGNGSGRLDVGVVMGWAQIKLNEELR